uniref:Uncharacterized protein n=1 Tax=Rhizophora mucronata TaxID=61149 RepID=A0A2P2K1H4_RHIMU
MLVCCQNKVKKPILFQFKSIMSRIRDKHQTCFDDYSALAHSCLSKQTLLRFIFRHQNQSRQANLKLLNFSTTQKSITQRPIIRIP